MISAKFARHVGSEPRHGRRRGEAVELQNLRQRSAPKRRPAGQHREQHAAEAIQIALRRDRAAVGLLGGHVFGRADQAAGRRQPRVAEQPRDAEIGQLQIVVGRQQQIGRLEIAMDDAVVVRMLQSPGELDAEAGGFCAN